MKLLHDFINIIFEYNRIRFTRNEFQLHESAIRFWKIRPKDCVRFLYAMNRKLIDQLEYDICKCSGSFG